MNELLNPRVGIGGLLPTNAGTVITGTVPQVGIRVKRPDNERSLALACGSCVRGIVNLILVARVSVVNLGPRFKFFSQIV